MKDKRPKELLEKQEEMKQATVRKVERAICDLQEQGCAVSIKNLVDYTGLSRSVFAKEHVREVLMRSGIKGDRKNKGNEAEKLAKRQRLRNEMQKKDDRIKQLMEEKEALITECELLRGKLMLLMQKVY